MYYSSNSVARQPIIFPLVVESNTVFPLSVCLKPSLIQLGQWNRNFIKAIILGNPITEAVHEHTEFQAYYCNS